MDGQTFAERRNEWVNIFIEGLRERTVEKHVAIDEGYKFRNVQRFQDNFDIDAAQFADMIDRSIANDNLVSGAMFFPRRMLMQYAERYPEETRDILRHLFDNSIDVAQRIDRTEAAFIELERRRSSDIGQEPANTFINLRFISLLLGYRYPDQYNALKPQEWKVFARFIDPGFVMPRHKSSGEQYATYCEYIEPLREYLKSLPRFNDIRARLTEGLAWKDEELRWVTQDVIFVGARTYATLQAGKKVETDHDKVNVDEEVEDANAEAVGEFDTGFMALEKHLEEYVIRNWNRIDFGEALRIYTDEDGTTGQQYTTDVGIIDILALDKDNNFVVIELKKAEYGSAVVGQTLNYMGWVKEKLADENQNVRGLIIVGSANQKLLSAAKMVSNMIAVKEYRVTMQLADVK
jgi:hypothetical protein